MNAIRATVRNGQVEPETPLPFPDGTKLIIRPSDPVLEAEADWDDSPAGIEARERWLDSLEPLTFTPEEEDKVRVAMEGQKNWEIEHATEHANKLREMWK